MRNGGVYLINIPLELQEQTFQEFMDFNKNFIKNQLAVLNIQFDLTHIKDDLFILVCEHNLPLNFSFWIKLMLRIVFHRKLKGVKLLKLNNKFWYDEVLKCHKKEF